MQHKQGLLSDNTTAAVKLTGVSKALAAVKLTGVSLNYHDISLSPIIINKYYQQSYRKQISFN